MKKASITIFSALSMMLIASLLFALLESARYYGLRLQTEQMSTLVTESVFAEYNAKIWEDYHLLFLDGAYGGEEFATDKVEGVAFQLMYDNLNYDLIKEIQQATTLLRVNETQVEVERYQLATDGEGDVFLNHVVDYMRQNIPQETAKAIYNRIQEGEDLEEKAQNNGTQIEKAQESLQEVTEEKDVVQLSRAGAASQEAVAEKDVVQLSRAGAASQEAATEKEATEKEATENDAAEKNEKASVLEFVLKLKQNAILGMVLPDVDAVSDKEITVEDVLMKRQCEQGTEVEAVETDWYARILYEVYLTTYFSNYTKGMENRALEYELEYIICGKSSDRANLEGVVERLMLAREAGNLASIMQDSAKVNEALAMATLLAGASANPGVIKAVQYGIIGAWAYLESILDIRSLLAGEKIAMIKTKAEWTTNVGNIISSFNNSKKAKECVNGLTYQDYLMQFLFLEGQKKLSYRTMDVMEKNVNLEDNYKNVRMDHMLVSAQFAYEYDAETLFWNLVLLDGKKDFSYRFANTRKFSYQVGQGR